MTSRHQLEAALRTDDPARLVLATVARFAANPRPEVAGAGGRPVETGGDGLVALFDSASAAIACCRGLACGAAVHAGDVELSGGSARGQAVDVTEQLLGLAGAGEVICSGTVVDLLAGGPHRFAEREPLALGATTLRTFALVGAGV